ncbi:winged helix-turn-helix domain-containing protein [Pediococcus parvulus]|uniref:Helix-turn-helix domain-containing protein n=1 Tax=Pediococcus parvulus TaxID=54062 RepID=A0A176THY1_9LACO|nr:helix-turn-helix domain-containing protein [Pediococcus parvulus]MDN5574715.1 helix-turn-helix domain-containing protein [Pediococcus sp.]MCT3027383.1 ArsR family transcriptional regulator [Pediococcus parvulus]MCT3031356.1 ArsR family transcriptional regulator [Pediococcus parvulus]MDV7693555.1 helix-turn-helix domain-containing protein [Pediococcus parvulus]OAD63081.1 hypothetical protein A7K95_10640 [Pediococcus parvulus]
MSSNKLDNLAKLLADPKVNRILEAARPKKGITVKQLAKILKEKPSNLYYPIQKMTDFGLLKVVAENEIKNLTEKVYSSASLYKRSQQKKLGLKENEIDLSNEYVLNHTDDLLEFFMINQKRMLTSFEKNMDFIQAGGKVNEVNFSWAVSTLELSKRGQIELLKKINQLTTDFKDPHPEDPQFSFNLDMTLYSDDEPKDK